MPMIALFCNIRRAIIKHINESSALFVAVKLDRIARNVHDLGHLLKTYFGDRCAGLLQPLPVLYALGNR